HRRRRRRLRHRLSAALRGVHRRVEPRSDRPRRQHLLRPEADDRRGAAWLGPHQRGAHGLDPAGPRLHRVALGAAARRLLPRALRGARPALAVSATAAYDSKVRARGMTPLWAFAAVAFLVLSVV